jgi:hypothetical protein
MTAIQAAKKLLRSEVKKRLLAMPKEQILAESDKLTSKVLLIFIYCIHSIYH